MHPNPPTLLFFITKTCLYNFDPLKPHFYIVKLGFTGVDIIFLIFARKHRLWVLVRTASPRRFLMSTHNLCFEQKYEKYQSFLSINDKFLEVKFSIYLNRRVFVMPSFGSLGRLCFMIVVFPDYVHVYGIRCVNFLSLVFTNLGVSVFLGLNHLDHWTWTGPSDYQLD